MVSFFLTRFLRRTRVVGTGNLNTQLCICEGAELGEPDCRLIEPFLLNQSSLTLSPWLMDYTSENKYMISSDKILTLADPNSELLEKYIKLTK